MKIKLYLFLMLGMFSTIANSETYTYGFENVGFATTPIVGGVITGPDVFQNLTNAQTNPIFYDVATFTGGAVLTNAQDFPAHKNYFPDNLNAYGTSNMGSNAGLDKALLSIDFLVNDHPDIVSFTLFNGLLTSQDYTVTVYLGDSTSYTVPNLKNLNGNHYFDSTTNGSNSCLFEGCGSFESVIINHTDIAKVTIEPNLHSSTSNGWDFLIDDVTFIGNGVSPVPEPESYAMITVGLVLMGFVGRRRKLL